ncbi:hypothetical protein OROMI_004228 [Orobanche minor]
MNNGELDDANNVPSLANILNNHVIIQSHTTINKDERLQSYCGLKLINMLSPQIGRARIRQSRKIPKRAALTTSGR